MAIFVGKRLLQTVVVIFLLTIFSFMLVALIPGDPVLRVLGDRSTQEQYDIAEHRLGLDHPLPERYVRWLAGVFHGNFGKSLIIGEDVAGLIKVRLPITFFLAFWAMLLSTIVGVILGIVCATRRGGMWDSAISMASNSAVAVPSFVLAILMIYLFGLKLGWLPIQGWTWPWHGLWRSVKLSVIPVAALSIPNIAVMTRQTRSSMLETIQMDYIRTATSKGLKKSLITYKHALRNALIPLVTVSGLAVTRMVGGQVVVETVCNIPGIGRLLVEATQQKDFLIVQAAVLVIGVVVVLINLLVEIGYGLIDPRIRVR